MATRGRAREEEEEDAGEEKKGEKKKERKKEKEGRGGIRWIGSRTQKQRKDQERKDMDFLGEVEGLICEKKKREEGGCKRQGWER